MKTIITISLLLISSLTLLAQDNNTTIGLKLYPGVSTIYNQITEDVKYSRSSFSGGIEIRQRLFKDLVFIETGVYFFDRGFKVTDYFDDIGVEIQNYLTLPVSLILKFNRIYLGVGGNMNYYLNRKFYINDDLISTDKAYQPDDVIFGAQLFLGYEFKIRKNYLLSIEGFASPIFKAKFINYGIGIGFKYAFNNNTIEEQ